MGFPSDVDISLIIYKKPTTSKIKLNLNIVNIKNLYQKVNIR